MQRRDDLLMRLLGEAMQRLGPEEAEAMAAHVGEEYGRSLASRMTPSEGQRTVRAAMHVMAETLTAHGFAAHAEDRGDDHRGGRRAVPLRRRQQHQPGAVRRRPRHGQGTAGRAVRRSVRAGRCR